MKLSALATTLFAALTLATPAPAPAAAAPAPHPHFRIQAKVLSGNPDFDGMYMYTYHTGAGTNTLAFANGAEQAPLFYHNDTRILSRLGGDFTYGLSLQGVVDYYAQWAPLSFNAGLGQKGFRLRPNGTLYNDNTNYAWRGFRVCRWYHQAPELFWSTALTTPGYVTCNCGIVQLIAKYNHPS